MSALTLGFIPLTDCAPLVVALEHGMFADEGLKVSLSREASWATIRDKVAVGALDGAHMLAPMALAASLGAGAEPAPLIAPMALNRHGSGITVSTELAQAMRNIDPESMAQAPRSARALARLIDQRKQSGATALTFAVVFPYSIHNYMLRYWMAQAGIDPDRDVRLVVTPPPRMVEQLRAGAIDGFCVGAPWNAVAVDEGAGEMLIRAAEFWRGGADKVFGVSRAWQASEPETLQAALRALLRAAAWADEPANRDSLVNLLSRKEYVAAAPAAIARALAAEISFYKDDAAFPWRSDAAWFLSQMVRWGQLDRRVDLASAQEVYRPDLYRIAAAALGLDTPQTDSKGSDRFFDGQVFDPGALRDYAEGFAITRATA